MSAASSGRYRDPLASLCLDDPMRLVPALVALKDADFGTIILDRVGRAPNQMGIAAALAAANRPNEFLLLDDEGTLLHSPAPDPDGRTSMQSDKRCGIRTKSPEL